MRPGSSPERFKRILVPTDFSEGAEQAVKYAVRFNDLYHAEIFLLHVFTLPEYLSPLSTKAKVDSEVADDVWEAAKKRALEKLEDIVRRLADKKGSANHLSLSIGCPFDEIVRFSAEREVDLIVMSTQERTGLGRILLGGTTQRVKSHAACPVLVLRQTGEAKQAISAKLWRSSSFITAALRQTARAPCTRRTNLASAGRPARCASRARRARPRRAEMRSPGRSPTQRSSSRSRCDQPAAS